MNGTSPRAVTVGERLDASALLVWNGLVTRIRRIGAERRDTGPVPPPAPPAGKRRASRQGAQARDGP